MTFFCMLLMAGCPVSIDGTSQASPPVQAQPLQLAQAASMTPVTYNTYSSGSYSAAPANQAPPAMAAQPAPVRVASVPPQNELLPPSKPFQVADILGQWKLNDGSTTTGVVQITQQNGAIVMQVVSETRYRVDWTPFGPPFATNWSLLDGKAADAANVSWVYSDTVVGCWVNKKVPVQIQMSADKRRVDFQVESYKAFTCQRDEKSPYQAFKLTRQL